MYIAMNIVNFDLKTYSFVRVICSLWVTIDSVCRDFRFELFSCENLNRCIFEHIQLLWVSIPQRKFECNVYVIKKELIEELFWF